jgi:hydroxymethylbilane synthase
MPNQAGQDSSPVRIGTRGSELALRQAQLVEASLVERGVPTELVTYTTVGDRRMNEPLRAIGAKGLFTAELENDLQDGALDCAVHSLKDLPTDSPYGVQVVTELQREDPRDVLVLSGETRATGLDDLPRGATVGTSSLRRRAQLMARRPDLKLVELRGNVPTRLRKVEEGRVDAAILAAAGLIRLGLRERIAVFLDPPDWLPAAGQGVIAVQARAADERMRGLLAPLHHAPTALASYAERTFLEALDGGCQVPIGALLVDGEEGPVLHGLIADPDGRRVLRASRALDPTSPATTAVELAGELMEQGGLELLQYLRKAGKVPTPQPE